MVSNRYFHFRNKHFFSLKILTLIKLNNSSTTQKTKAETISSAAKWSSFFSDVRWKNAVLYGQMVIILLRCSMEECRPLWPNGGHSSQMLDGRMPSFLARRMRLSSLSPIPRILPQMAYVLYSPVPVIRPVFSSTDARLI